MEKGSGPVAVTEPAPQGPTGPAVRRTPEPRPRRIRRPGSLFVTTSLTPIVALFLLFSILPILASVVLALFRYSAIDPRPPFIGLGNFVSLFRDPIFLKSLGNTFEFVLLAVPINILVTLPIAVGLHNLRRRWLRDGLRALYFLPTIAPIVAAAVIWAYLYEPTQGLVNMALSHLGFGRILWLGDIKTAMPAIIVMSLWQDIGYNIVIFLAGLEVIPAVFYEAAAIDGAGRWQQFRHITLPLLARTSAFILVMTMISYLQVFAQVQVMTNGGPHDTTRVLGLFIYDNAFRYTRMGYASAAAVVLLAVTMVITLLQLWLMKKSTSWRY